MTLVIGYGNPMRSDDGLGIYLAELLEKQNIPGVEVMTCHQLTPELVEDMIQYKNVILIDAGLSTDDFKIEKVEKNSLKTLNSSHHVAPSVLLNLTEDLYGKNLSLSLCTLKGENFDFGSEISDASRKRVNLCLTALKRHIQEVSYA